MKILIVTILATLSMALGAAAQGSAAALNDSNLFFGLGVGTEPITIPQSEYYTNGDLSVTIYFSSTATTNALNNINAFNGTIGGGTNALALTIADGFQEVATGAGGSDQYGMIEDFTPYTFDFPDTFAPDTAGIFVLYFITSDGNYSGAVAFTSNYGGNPSSIPPGIPADWGGFTSLVEWADNNNLALVPIN